MAQLIINIPDDKLQDVLDTLCDHFSYKADSGLTKAQFVKSKVIELIKGAYIRQKSRTLEQSYYEQLRTQQQETMTGLNLS